MEEFGKPYHYNKVKVNKYQFVELRCVPSEERGGREAGV